MSNAVSDNMIGILADLIGFKTVSGDTLEAEHCFDYIQSFLLERNMHVERMSSNNFPSIVATPNGSKTPHILLQAHIDVVPAPLSCFKLTKKAHKLYGRGVFDMKFAVACYLQLIDDLKNDLSSYDFGLMLTCDEEIGGKNGVGYLLDKGYSADVCILPDGGNNWQIETTCNAVWIIRLIADGQTAHGSRPWEGRNAIKNLLEALSDIHDVFGELMPNRNSISISTIQGGQAMNQVPEHAEAIVDMRFINDQEYVKHSKTITHLAKTYGLDIETMTKVAARHVAVNEPAIKNFLSIANNLLDKPITKTHSLGASDACYFASHGIPTIVLRPSGGGEHSDNEWIGTEDLEKFYELIKSYIMQTTRVD
jgi:acetylornithine deacetylase/succinyl-diaminopimelate desuccinylase-like protein